MTFDPNQVLIYSQIGVAVATVLASIALVWFTAILAKHTRRMADNTSKPDIVATLEPNHWSLMHFDLRIANAGNAPAFDIKIAFDPKLPSADIRDEGSVPFQNLSVLRPGQEIASYVSEYAKLQGQAYRVTIEWKRKPDSKSEAFSYTINIADYDSVSRLGAVDPATQIAEQVKKIREDWQSVARGSNRVNVDVFTQFDRNAAKRVQKKWYDRARKEREAEKDINGGETNSDS